MFLSLDECFSAIASEVAWTKRRLSLDPFDDDQRARIEGLCRRITDLLARARTEAARGRTDALGLALTQIAATWHDATEDESRRSAASRPESLLRGAGIGLIQAATAALDLREATAANDPVAAAATEVRRYLGADEYPGDAYVPYPATCKACGGRIFHLALPPRTRLGERRNQVNRVRLTCVACGAEGEQHLPCRYPPPQPDPEEPWTPFACGCGGSTFALVACHHFDDDGFYDDCAAACACAGCKAATQLSWDD